MNHRIPIEKMAGAGNDFVVLRGEDAERIGDDLPRWIRQVCRRGLSVGADGVIAVDPVRPGRAAVRFWNPDGSPAFCGNGTRCAARFAHDRGWVGATFVLHTAVGEVPGRIDAGRVGLDLPPPEDRGDRDVRVDGDDVRGRYVIAGVPHFVIEVPDVGSAPLERLGPALRRHETFGADGANVDLVARAADGVFDLRTWERGVEGETLACGTGAVAAAAAIRARGGPEDVRLRPKSGAVLDVRLPGPPGRPGLATLTGDARRVFVGDLDPEAWSD